MSKYKRKLYGAILGDLAGQPYEFPPMKGPYENVNIHNPNSHITDDTVMTLASAHAIVNDINIEMSYKMFGRKYPDAGYGAAFKDWVKKSFNPAFNPKGTSWGNGCLMRASPFMYAEDSLPLLLESVMCSHNHTISYESVIKLYHLYKDGWAPYIIAKGIRPIRPFDKFEVKADRTVDFCMNVAVQSYSTKKAIVNAIEAGGDTDTNASIVGEITNHLYKDITDEDAAYVESKLDDFQLEVLKEFNERFDD